MSRSSSACPGDREVDLKRAGGGRSRRPRSRPSPRPTSPSTRPGQGLHRARRAGREERQRHPLPARPARRRRHRLGHRRQRARAARLRPGRRAATSTATAPSRRPRCGPATRRRTARGPLELARGIEIGHIFQLGRKYAEALDLKVLDENGKQVTVTMGSYGIGVSRAVAAVAETTHDELGLCWPREIAPADVHIVAAGKDDAVLAAAEQLTGRPRRARCARAARRPARGLARREVQGLRAARRPDHRRRRQGPGRRRDRGQGPAHGRPRRGPVGEVVDHLVALVRA